MRTALAMVAAVAVALGSLQPATAALQPDFDIGWYESVAWPSHLPGVSTEQMTSVIAYSSPDQDVDNYLDRAEYYDLDVWVEVPRPLVKKVDVAAVQEFVDAHEDHVALAGWYLADEPTLQKEVGPLSAEDATTLYEAIKDEDPMHRVAIAFSPLEYASITSFKDAMDVLMFDDYPAIAGSPEFNGLGAWWQHVKWASSIAEGEDGFVPVIQAFSNDLYRLPTATELRYMSYASVQADATSIYYWYRMLSDDEWMDETLEPLVAEMRDLTKAFGRPEITDKITVDNGNVGVTLYKQPGVRRFFMVAVNHGPETEQVSMRIARSLRIDKVRVRGVPGRVRAPHRTITTSLAPYEARVYVLSR